MDIILYTVNAENFNREAIHLFFNNEILDSANLSKIEDDFVKMLLVECAMSKVANPTIGSA